MQLFLLTPLSNQHYDIFWIELNTPNGNYVLQPGHVPTILALSPDKPFIYALKSGKEEIVMVKNGVAQVTRESIMVLYNPA